MDSPHLECIICQHKKKVELIAENKKLKERWKILTEIILANDWGDGDYLHTVVSDLEEGKTENLGEP